MKGKQNITDELFEIELTINKILLTTMPCEKTNSYFGIRAPVVLQFFLIDDIIIIWPKTKYAGRIIPITEKDFKVILF